MKPRNLILAAVAAAILCAPVLAMGAKEPATEKPLVAVSILPQQYFVQRIAQDRVRALVLVGPGQSPHSYEPTPRQIADLGTAAAWFSIGVEFETALLPKISGLYPDLRIVDTTNGVPSRLMTSHHHEGDVEDHEEEGGRDPHIWLGRAGAKAQAEYIRDTLSAVDPSGASEYAQNCQELIQDIDSTFDALKKSLEPLKGKPVFVFHPSFGYFLDEFGIEQVAVEDQGKEPTQKGLAGLIAEAKEEGAKAIFVQPQFSQSAAKTVADAIGGVVVEINPLDADWLENLRRLGAALETAVR